LDAGEVSARRRPPQDIRAYDLFLRGLRLSDTFTPEAQAQVEAFYEGARAIDPSFARAYSGLAFVHMNRSYDAIAGVQSQPNEHELSALRLAEEALALDPNDPRVHSTLGLMCVNVRDFERAERHLDLARAMNPNDAVVQILWARLQGIRGRPEYGIAAAETGCRLNPRHPPWYNSFIAQMHFQLGHYDETSRLLEKRMWNVPARHLHDLGWRVAAYGHQGRLTEASGLGEELIREIGSHWRGDPSAKPSDYMDWIVWYSLLERSADRERLRTGLRLAGLPA
jgi:tetratricopeptide (TPR) repeat protein